MADPKSIPNRSHPQTLRLCDLTLIPLSQLNCHLGAGYCVPVVKPGVDSTLPTLTPRERNCLRSFALDGLPLKAIAEDMGVTVRTTRQIIATVRRKFQTHTNHALMQKIFVSGLDRFL